MKKQKKTISCLYRAKAVVHTIIVIITVCVIAFAFSCCFENDPDVDIGGFEEQKTGNAIKIINWNLQTFFDAQTCGSEYSEFFGSNSIWDEEHYKKRLDQLCTFIVEEDADVYVFEEIENAEILQDISNSLPALNRGKNPWQYACFGISSGSALGLAVLSRYELANVQLHQIDYRAAYKFDSLINVTTIPDISDGGLLDPPSMRPLLEVDVCGENSVHLFVCHWKSKFGDTNGETAIWRQLQERLLVDRILDLQHTCGCSRYLVCGDFNQKLEEFDTRDGSFHTVNGCNTKVVLHGSCGLVSVYSPWNKDSDSGSYYYDSKWEKIDHFFASENLSLISFESLKDGDLTVDGIPARYDIWSGSGLSDHLPIMCWITSL